MSKYQERLKQYIERAEQKGHACMGCDMGDAGPGPQDKHDADCFLLQTQAEIQRLEDGINFAIQCLTSGNSVFVSDTRPALKYLNKALEDD